MDLNLDEFTKKNQYMILEKYLEKKSNLIYLFENDTRKRIDSIIHLTNRYAVSDGIWNKKNQVPYSLKTNKQKKINLISY